MRRLPGPVVEPLAEDRYLIKFTAGAAMVGRLRQAQELLRHAVPSGDAGEIFDRALNALLADLAKKKHAATERPRSLTLGRAVPPWSSDAAPCTLRP